MQVRNSSGQPALLGLLNSIENKMADVLALLRQFNLQKKEIIERDDLVIFDQLAWSKHAKTNYTVYRWGVSRGS